MMTKFRSKLDWRPFDTEGLARREVAYLDKIDAEAIRRGYMPPRDSLVAATGTDAWLEAWRFDPSLTPEQQVDNEILAAEETLGKFAQQTKPLEGNT